MAFRWGVIACFFSGPGIGLQTEPCNQGLSLPQWTRQDGRSNRKGEAVGQIKGFKGPKGGLGEVQLQPSSDMNIFNSIS